MISLAKIYDGMTVEDLVDACTYGPELACFLPTVPEFVYISGPYSSDPEANTQEAIRVATIFGDAGFIVFVPHLTHFWHKQCPRPYEFWLRQDLFWIGKCHILIRLPGESSGADREVARAIELNNLVLYWRNEKLWLWKAA